VEKGTADCCPRGNRFQPKLAAERVAAIASGFMAALFAVGVPANSRNSAEPSASNTFVAVELRKLTMVIVPVIAMSQAMSDLHS